MSTKKPMDELESICKKIVKIDSKIRFAGIISEKGRLLAGHKKEGIRFLVNEKNQEMLFMGVALKERMRREYDEQLGPVDFTVSHRAKCVIMGFRFGEDLIYVSSEKDVDLTKVTSRILEIVKEECGF